MSNSLSYASHLASSSESPQHASHVYEFRELATMIAQEQIELYLPRIEAMVNNTVHYAISSALNSASKSMDISIKRIVDVTCKELNAQFHSEELSNWVLDTVHQKLEDALKNIDVNLIVK